ncbi:hypothetical protein KUTeg_019838 [Tegillarca granosa]|uniref:DNA topoisomerase I n=1 Tax=Tegillarca granosa TaxID=220873 RepID=A0ABQ9EDQ8_TEGGR|nr:hypothetical protein KUTeg_019838 [Tegillarca granosa]
MDILENDLDMTNGQEATETAAELKAKIHQNGDVMNHIDVSHQNGDDSMSNHASKKPVKTERDSSPSKQHSSSSSSKHSSSHSSSSKSKDPHPSSSSSKHSSCSSSSKHKDGSSSSKSHHSSSSSSSSKHKDGSSSSSSKHKDGSSSSSSSKHKEGSSSHSSSSKHKSSSSEHKSSSSSSDKHKDRSKDGSSSDKHKDRHKEGSSSSSDKHKERSKDGHSSSSDKHKERSKEGHSSSNDKHKERSKDGHSSSSDKHKERSKDGEHKSKSSSSSHSSSDKHKDKHSSKPKESSSEGKHKDKNIEIKKEPSSPTKASSPSKSPKKEIKSEDEFSPKKPEIKEEPQDEPMSEDDVPLSVRAKEVTPTTKRAAPESDDDDEPLSARVEKVKKKIKKEEKHEKSAKKRKQEDSDDEKPVKKKKIKKESDTSSPEKGKKKKKKEGEEGQPEVWRWWEEESREDGVKWNFLEHKGPIFAPDYEPLPDHVMTQAEKEKITDLKKCRFNEINDYFKLKSEERKNRSKEEKKAEKLKNDEIQKEYGVCIFDGHQEKIGNFRIEPPGLFRGRGEHPKQGMLKKRIQPEDVIINCSKNSKIPQPPEGHKWKEVRHDNKVSWLACWTENIQGQTKYVMLNAASRLKGEKDWQKYETARKLHKIADNIRENYRNDWKSKEMRIRQRAVALYFIDKLALRAGNEKEEGETADTVGCCSLRVEHIKLHEKYDDLEYVVEFDFLGKDSIRYYNRVPTAILNKHLHDLMPGLTAKVFRTYNASKTLQEQLNLLTEADDNVNAKLLSYNRANRAVAILCNHQRAVPKNFDKQMENLQSKIDAKKDAIKDAKKQVKAAKADYKATKAAKAKQILDKKKKMMERLEEQLVKLEVQATDKDENKEIALGTSKLNYLDPRISVAWCKKWEVPVEKIYNKTQRDKFRWAIDMADEDYQF